MRIVGSGALNLDFFYQVEDISSLESVKLSPGGERWGSRREFEKLREELEKKGRFIAKSGGGSAANTIYALKSWGFQTAFIGIVGKDQEGDEILAELEGVELSRVLREGESACCLIVLDARKDRAIFVSPHSRETALKDFRIRISSREWLHLSSLITDEGFSFHLRLKEEHAGPVSVDPGEIYARRGASGIISLLRGSKIIFLTHQELSLLGLQPDKLSELAEWVFLKKGAQGATLLNGKSCPIPPVPAEKLVDNTGAGDVFNAGVLAGILKGLDPHSAGKLGAHLAAISLRDYGRKGYPTREEFEKWIKSYCLQT